MRCSLEHALDPEAAPHTLYLGGVDAAPVLDGSGRAFGEVAVALDWEGPAAVASLDADCPVELL